MSKDGDLKDKYNYRSTGDPLLHLQSCDLYVAEAGDGFTYEVLGGLCGVQ